MFKRVIRSISVFVLMAVLGGAIGGTISVLILMKDLPEVETLKQYKASNATEVYSADGIKIGEFTTERRYPVSMSNVPEHVVQAFVAAEDSNFYQHHGVDLKAFARAVITNVAARRFAQGASTITQQVARGILLGSRRKKISRKVREMILAYRMERKLSKQEILGLYLNEIYLGHGAYGIGAAARNYFHKEVQELNLAEASLLAGLPQRPAEWDPFNSPYKARRRQRYVINRMVEEEYISVEEANEALALELRLYPLENINLKAAPYFVEYVRTYLMKKYGGENVLKKGYKVHTTVRYDFQKKAEVSVDAGLREVDKRIGWRGPIQHLNTDQDRKLYLEDTHEKIIRKISASRVLVAAPEQNEALGYDLKFLEAEGQPYYGQTPIKEGNYYKAVVEKIDDKAGELSAKIGETAVIVPLKSMEWVKVAEEPLKQISQILIEGDVVEVKVTKIDREAFRVEAALEQQPEVQGALLSYEVETGLVMAMVGGRDFEESEFNRALIAKRQVGSTFKPILYAGAIDKGFSPSSVVTDSPLVFRFEGDEEAGFEGDDWKPRNYGQRFSGEIPLRTALIRSMNIPTIKVLHQIGVEYTIDYAKNLGITAPFPKDLSISLGSWSSSLEDLMRAYAVFPRLGKPQDLIYVQKVVDRDGNILEDNASAVSDQKILGLEKELEDRAAATDGLEEEEKPVISPQTAYVMTDWLKAVVREGTGRRAAYVGRNVAGKTGTSNDFHDAWFIGYTPHVMTGVWVGFDTSRPMAPGDGGGRAAAPIFANFMSQVVKQYPDEDFAIPDNIEFANIDRKTGRRATSITSPEDRKLVAFKAGTVPDRYASNVPRITEPGVREMTGDTLPALNKDGPSARPQAQDGLAPLEEEEELTDFLREGYDE